MNVWKYSTTDEHLDFLDFHDAVVERIQILEDQIIVDLESVNILANHPLNPYAVAKSTDNCRLIFVQPVSSEANLYLEDKTIRQIECTALEEMEILKFTRVEQKDGNTYEIFGSDTHFCGWKVQAKGLIFSWNEFAGDAWFEGWE